MNRITRRSGDGALFIILLSTFYFLLSFSSAVFAQEKFTLTVTPPLFQLTIGPGEFWASSLKAVNTNPYDVTLYASVMNFESSGEEGQGKFTPLVDQNQEANPNTLARWIEVSREPIFVPKGTSAEIPFSIRIPEDAPPGGHYAAILVGLEPAGDASGPTIRVSSYVSSLFFVRIKGDVREEGGIREFRTNQSRYESAKVDFTLRFENTGTVHVRPAGSVIIYDMWGKERGRVALNEKTDFGNVLPKSTRKFLLSWEGESRWWDFGRHRAIVTLAYGAEARQNVSDTTYFWIVPLKPLGVAMGGIAAFTLFVVWAIRVYVRRVVRRLRPVLHEEPAPAPLEKNVVSIRKPQTGNTVNLKDTGREKSS